MLKIKSCAVIGGDVRQQYLCEKLIEQGYIVNTYNDLYDNTVRFSSIGECIKKSDALILPLPISRDGKTLYTNETNENIALQEIFNDNLNGKIVFGGKADENILSFIHEHKIHFYDYFTLEGMTVKNAIATAEGAVAIAIENTRFTLLGSKILVAGYGRISKALTKILLSFGAKVTVAARNRVQRDWAIFQGADAIDFNSLTENGDYSLVFNTVPHIIFTKTELEHFKKGTLIIDLASFPGGVDLHRAKSYDLRVITASALPSKFSPQSAGEFIADSIISVIKEEV